MVLSSRSFSGMLPGMIGGCHGMVMHASALPIGSDYPVFSINVIHQVSDSPKLPRKVSTIKRYTLSYTDCHIQAMLMALNRRPYGHSRKCILANSAQFMELFHDHGGSMSMMRDFSVE